MPGRLRGGALTGRRTSARAIYLRRRWCCNLVEKKDRQHLGKPSIRRVPVAKGQKAGSGSAFGLAIFKAQLDRELTLKRLAALKPRTLATMHGSTFVGDGEKALGDLAQAMKDVLGQS